MPERTCVACRAKRERSDLLRVARRPDGTVAADPEGKAPGRGAYVCRRAGCVAEAQPRLSRALRRPLTDEDLARLREEMERQIR